jgi:hypothetical protein
LIGNGYRQARSSAAESSAQATNGLDGEDPNTLTRHTGCNPHPELPAGEAIFVLSVGRSPLSQRSITRGPNHRFKNTKKAFFSP